MAVVSRYLFHEVRNLVQRCSFDLPSQQPDRARYATKAHLKYATFAATLTAQNTYLGKIYCCSRGTDSCEDILEFVDSPNYL
jgi:hypothetical protein